MDVPRWARKESETKWDLLGLLQSILHQCFPVWQIQEKKRDDLMIWWFRRKGLRTVLSRTYLTQRKIYFYSPSKWFIFSALYFVSLSVKHSCTFCIFYLVRVILHKNISNTSSQVARCPMCNFLSLLHVKIICMIRIMLWQLHLH